MTDSNNYDDDFPETPSRAEDETHPNEGSFEIPNKNPTLVRPIHSSGVLESVLHIPLSDIVQHGTQSCIVRTLRSMVGKCGAFTPDGSPPELRQPMFLIGFTDAKKVDDDWANGRIQTDVEPPLVEYRVSFHATFLPDISDSSDQRRRCAALVEHVNNATIKCRCGFLGILIPVKSSEHSFELNVGDYIVVDVRRYVPELATDTAGQLTHPAQLSLGEIVTDELEPETKERFIDQMLPDLY